jgi:hypothetical protein
MSGCVRSTGTASVETSLARLRDASVLARLATRTLTPYNHRPSESSTRTEPAFLTRIRNVA